MWQYESFDSNRDGRHEFGETMHRAVGSVALADGLALVADLAGILHCLDARTGRAHWSHDLASAVWSTPLLADGRVYIADEDGDVTVFRLAAKKEQLAEFNVNGPVYGSFAAAEGGLFLATANKLLAVSQPPPAIPGGAEWPVFRQGTQSRGTSLAGLPGKPELLWKRVCQVVGGGDERESFEGTAAISGGTVFLGGREGSLYALDLRSGAEKWHFKNGAGFSAPASVQGGLVYLGDLEGKLLCLDAVTGALKWTFAAEGAIENGANFYRDRVIFGSQDASLYCLDAATGRLIWKLVTDDQIRSFPTITGDRIFVAGCDGKLHVVDATTGRPVAAVALDGPTACTPAVLGERLFVGTEQGKFLGIDWRDAKTVWTYEHPERKAGYRSSPAATDDVVVTASRGKFVAGLNPKTGEQLWMFNTASGIDGSPAIADGRVYFGTSRGRLHALDIKTGKQVWEHVAGGGFQSSPAVAGGRLVIGSDDGVVYCFGAKPPVDEKAKEDKPEGAGPPVTKEPTTEAEKAISQLVLVFFQDRLRRTVEGVMLDAGGETWVVTAGPATMVPDGTPPAIDRAFVNLAGKLVKAEYHHPASNAELFVYRAEGGLTGFKLEERATVSVGDSLSVMTQTTEGDLRVTPKAVKVTALDGKSELDLPATKVHHSFEKLIVVDRPLREGTPLFKDGKLAGLTLLGSRFLGKDAKKSYVVPAARIAALFSEIKKKAGGADGPAAKAATTSADSARIVVKYDIADAEADAKIYVQHIGGRGDIGTETLGPMKWNPLKNGETLELKDLGAGDYQVARYRQVEIGRVGTTRIHSGLYLDRRQFKLKDGETAAIDFTRPKSRPVKGRVLGLKEAKIDGAVVCVCSESAKDDESLGSLAVTIFDARLCDKDGAFQAERLAPGKYVILVNGYEPWTEEELRFTGVRRPRYTGVARVTVPEAGEAPPVEVSLRDTQAKAETEKPKAEPDRAAPAKEKAKEKAGTTKLRGRVVDADDKPIRGAQVRATFPHLNTSAAATSDAEGSFTLDCGDSARFDEAAAREPKFEANLVASAEGFTFDFHHLSLEKLAGSDLTFRLAKPIAVEGRIVDGDGRALKDVEVAIASIARPAGGLEAYLRMIRRKELLASGLESTWYGAGDAKSPVKTDADGRFRLSPLGAERVVTLTLKASDGAKHTIIVVMRPAPDKDDKSGLLDTFHSHYYAKFVHALETGEKKADLSQLDGAWVIESFNLSGKPVSEDVLKRLKDEPLVIAKGKATTSTGISLVFETTKTPFTMTGMNANPAIDGVHGIWRVADDVLTICRTSRDQPLPDKFSSTPDNGWQLRTYRRQKTDRTAAVPRKGAFEPFECESIDAVTGKPITDVTVQFLYKQPATAGAAEETVSNLIYTNVKISRFHFVVPDEVRGRPELVIQWSAGHPDYEPLAPTERVPLAHVLRDEPKSARDTFRRIALKPKKKEPVKPDLATELATSIAFHVMDRTGQKPIPRFRVMPGHRRKEGDREKPIWDRDAARTGKDGYLPWPLADLDEREWAFLVEADGHEAQPWTWIKKTDGPKYLVFLLAEVAKEGTAAKKDDAWGDLALRFVYDGPRPKPARIPVRADAAAFGRDVPDESLLVGDDGGLANVVVYLTSKDVPVHPAERKRADTPAELTVADGLFRPRVLPLEVGQKLRLNNPSPVPVSFRFGGAQTNFSTTSFFQKTTATIPSAAVKHSRCRLIVPCTRG